MYKSTAVFPPPSSLPLLALALLAILGLHSHTPLLVTHVSQNQFYNQFPVIGTPPLPTSCGNNNAGFYNCPSGLGVTNKTIGQPRQIQMTLQVQF